MRKKRPKYKQYVMEKLPTLLYMVTKRGEALIYTTEWAVLELSLTEIMYCTCITFIDIYRGPLIINCFTFIHYHKR